MTDNNILLNALNDYTAQALVVATNTQAILTQTLDLLTTSLKRTDPGPQPSIPDYLEELLESLRPTTGLSWLQQMTEHMDNNNTASSTLHVKKVSDSVSVTMSAETSGVKVEPGLLPIPVIIAPLISRFLQEKQDGSSRENQDDEDTWSVISQRLQNSTEQNGELMFPPEGTFF